MERRDTQQTVDVKTLTKRAITLYLEQSAGEEIDPSEIAKLREDAHSFSDPREFKDFRVAVGTTALQGKFKFGEKDAGSEIMGIIFEEGDRQLYDSIVILSQALEMTPRDYTITTMLNIQDGVEERRREGNLAELEKELQAHGYTAAELEWAERTLKEFLATKAGASIREQMLLRQEVKREDQLVEEAEKVFARPTTAEETKRELQKEKGRIKALWRKLKEEPFEQAPVTNRRIIHTQALIEELQGKLRVGIKKKPGKQPDVMVPIPPEEEVARKWTVALKRLANQFRLDAEDENLRPEEAERLKRRADQYEAEAKRLLTGIHIPATEATS